MRVLRFLPFLCLVCSGVYATAQSLTTSGVATVAFLDGAPSPKSAPYSVDKTSPVPSGALADDIDPNPPDADDLARNGRTWRGEYELDKRSRPLLDEHDKAIPILYDKKEHRIRMTAKVPKPHPAKVVAGVLTVDGWMGKMQLNYDIRDLRYLYISAPPVGTMIVANSAFPGAVEVRDAFSKSGLMLKMGDHEVLLETKEPISREKSAGSAWVKVDAKFLADRRSPVLGYGTKLVSPYQWPGAKMTKASDNGYVPPLPENMRPKLAQPICTVNKPCGS